MIQTYLTTEKLPFPYFLINKNNLILNTSIKTNPPIGKSMTNIVHDENRFKNFIYETNKTSSEFTLLINNQYQLHQIFKYEDGEYIHLYCIPAQKEHPCKNKMEQDSIHESFLKKVNTLTADIVHEIRNPLTVVHGFLQLLEPILSANGKKQYADIALNELSRANQILTKFLEEAKPQQTQKEIINLNQVIKETCILFESESILKNVEMTVQYFDNPLLIEIELNQLKQVLLNLIKNAFEAINETQQQRKGLIKITTKAHEGKVILMIEDNGKGMNKETIDQLFTPFFTTKEKGTGIGLSICKEILLKNNGVLTVKSEIGSGTIFVIELPNVHI